MALLTQTHDLHIATRYGKEQNINMAMKKDKPQLTARTTLANIGNKTVLPTIVEAKNMMNKEAVLKRGMVKSTATSQLHVMKDKENVSHSNKNLKELKPEVKQIIKHIKEEKPSTGMSPGPMDISISKDGFSQNILPNNVNDIDSEDNDNPQLVSNYVNCIYNYMRELEVKYPIKVKYLEGREISGRMRSILIDWLVQVHLRFHLLQETLYLTVAIIDRFLQGQDVVRNRLQLVGVTSMLIASKYEEMYAPEVADFVYITDEAYTKADIRKMECLILRSLDFQLGRPLPIHFLRRNSKAAEVDAKLHTLAKYLMELTIVDYDSVNVLPSEIAAASLCLSMKLLDSSEWEDTVAYYSNYSETQLDPIIRKIAQLVLKAGTGKLTAIKNKYQSSKFLRISGIPELKNKLITELSES